MTFENDPNRRPDLRPGERSRFDYTSGDGFGWLPAILAVAAIVLLLMLLLPGRETGNQLTQNTTGTEQSTRPAPAPTTPPPANTPSPTTPAPQK